MEDLIIESIIDTHSLDCHIVDVNSKIRNDFIKYPLIGDSFWWVGNHILHFKGMKNGFELTPYDSDTYQVINSAYDRCNNKATLFDVLTYWGLLSVQSQPFAPHSSLERRVYSSFDDCVIYSFYAII